MQRLGRVVGGAPVVLVVPSVATPEVRFSSTSVSPCVARWIRSSRGSPSLAVVAQAAIIMRAPQARSKLAPRVAVLFHWGGPLAPSFRMAYVHRREGVGSGDERGSIYKM